MSRTVRITVAVAALLLSAAYILPLWRISLIAPQYPEGLGMLIRVNTVTGVKEADLNSINGLNHYIGMKAIVPDAIPELRFMPVLLGVLVASGLGVAAMGKRAPFVVWSVGLAAVLVAGLADFWKWGHEYGHDLSPTAIIKIPGMSYQPPLIGSKQLLNFHATSWPASGGMLLIVAALLVAWGLFKTLFTKRVATVAAAAAVTALAAACGETVPRAFALNEDACGYCRMTISDTRFGGEAITKNGRIQTFDSVECLAAWARNSEMGSVSAIYVMDFQHPGKFVRADSAGFLQKVLINTPMGRSVVAFATPAAAEQQRAMLGGDLIAWGTLVADTASKPGTR